MNCIAAAGIQHNPENPVLTTLMAPVITVTMMVGDITAADLILSMVILQLSAATKMPQCRQLQIKQR
jgi:hypothetical protein